MSDSPYIVEVTEQNFQSVVLDGSMQVPVLVDFWAEWCGPCKTLMPLLARLAEEYSGRFILAKIDTEEQQRLAMHFGIRSIPTVKLFKGGELVDEFMGALPEAQLREFLGRHIEGEADGLIEQAERCLLAGDADGATDLLDQARAENPDDPRTLVAYARLKATLGEIEQAELILDGLPANEQLSDDVKVLRARLLFDRAVQGAPGIAELEQRLARDPKDSEAHYLLAAWRVMDNDLAGALELLLGLLMRDRGYGEDAARKGMVAIFEILGGQGELVSRFRNRMFAALH